MFLSCLGEKIIQIAGPSVPKGRDQITSTIHFVHTILFAGSLLIGLIHFPLKQKVWLLKLRTYVCYCMCMGVLFPCTFVYCVPTASGGDGSLRTRITDGWEPPRGAGTLTSAFSH